MNALLIVVFHWICIITNIHKNSIMVRHYRNYLEIDIPLGFNCAGFHRRFVLVSITDVCIDFHYVYWFPLCALVSTVYWFSCRYLMVSITEYYHYKLLCVKHSLRHLVDLQKERTFDLVVRTMYLFKWTSQIIPIIKSFNISVDFRNYILNIGGTCMEK